MVGQVRHVVVSAGQNERMTVTGVVREWHEEEGWGVVDCSTTPGGCWTHFSAVAVPGYKLLSAGQVVELEWETAQQDGYGYRAVRAWPRGQDPHAGQAVGGPTGAYRSSLTITFGAEGGQRTDE